MQHHAADQLHVEMALAERALGGLAHRGEGLDQQVVERLALGQALLQPGRARPQRVVGERLDRRLERVDRGDEGLHPLENRSLAEPNSRRAMAPNIYFCVPVTLVRKGRGIPG